MIIFGEVFHRVKTSERRRDRTAGEKRNSDLNLEVTCHRKVLPEPERPLRHLHSGLRTDKGGPVASVTGNLLKMTRTAADAKKQSNILICYFCIFFFF